MSLLNNTLSPNTPPYYQFTNAPWNLNNQTGSYNQMQQFWQQYGFGNSLPNYGITAAPQVITNPMYDGGSVSLGNNTWNLPTTGTSSQPQGLFAQAKDWWNNSSFQDKGAALQGVISTASSLWDMYQKNRAYKLAKTQWEEQKALQRANYTNQAKAMNAMYRDQQSGRSTTLMSNSARQSLRNNYQSRKVKESYW